MSVIIHLYSTVCSKEENTNVNGAEPVRVEWTVSTSHMNSINIKSKGICVTAIFWMTNGRRADCPFSLRGSFPNHHHVLVAKGNQIMKLGVHGNTVDGGTLDWADSRTHRGRPLQNLKHNQHGVI